MELQLSRSGRRVQVGTGEALGLQVLVGIAIERHGLPFAVQEGAKREMIGDLAGGAIHGFAEVVGRIAVVVGAEVRRLPKVTNTPSPRSSSPVFGIR